MRLLLRLRCLALLVLTRQVFIQVRLLVDLGLVKDLRQLLERVVHQS